MIEVAAVAMCVFCVGASVITCETSSYAYIIYMRLPPRDNIRFCLHSVMEKYLRLEICLQDSHSESSETEDPQGLEFNSFDSSLSHGVDK